MKCPQCQSEMIGRPAPEKRAIVKPMIDSMVPAARAADIADRIHEKEDALGVVYTCVNARCNYQMRVKPEDADGEGNTAETETTGARRRVPRGQKEATA